MQQKIFVIESIGEEPMKAYNDLDTLFRSTVAKYGAMDADSKERAKRHLEQGRTIAGGGVLFRCYDADGKKTSFIVFEAVVQSK